MLCLPAQPRRNGVRGSESTLTRRLRDLPRFQQNACSACRELPRRGALRECSNIKLLAVGRTRVAIAPGASPFLRGAASRQYTCVSFQFSLSFRLTPKQTMLLGKPHPLRPSGVLHDIIATNTEICTGGDSTLPHGRASTSPPWPSYSPGQCVGPAVRYERTL